MAGCHDVIGHGQHDRHTPVRWLLREVGGALGNCGARRDLDCDSGGAIFSDRRVLLPAGNPNDVFRSAQARINR